MLRRLAIGLALAAVMTAGTVAPARAAAPTSDPPTAAKMAASWLARQVTAGGFIPQAADPSQPNLSASAQAVLALAAAGVGRPQVDALIAYLTAHLDDFVISKGNDDPGALAYMILGLTAAGDNPTDVGSGHANLVTRLESTRQADGLFGAGDPTFDGAFRQGLALLALNAAGVADSPAANWLEGQQCPDGSWTAFRADTSQPCPAVDPATFTGPDTNSTALAVLGLAAQGRSAPAATGASALDGVRNAEGGWGFLARSDQQTDANSTGVVLLALRKVRGAQDARGTAALLALQVGCDAAAADAGGVAFQSAPDGLVPDALATAQAAPALAGVALPLRSVTIGSDLVAPCPAVATTTTASASTDQAPATDESSPAPTVARAELPRTGAPDLLATGAALCCIGAGGLLVQLAENRRRRCS